MISGTRFRQALNLQSTLFDIHGLPDSKEAWADHHKLMFWPSLLQGSLRPVFLQVHVITATGASFRVPNSV